MNKHKHYLLPRTANMTLYYVTLILIIVSTGSEGTDLNLFGLFPMTGAWNGGQSLLTAVQMAIDEIHARDDILPGYTIKLTWRDSKCNGGYGIKQMTDSLAQEPTKLVLLGGSCSGVSKATAQASHFWNLSQVSYGSASPSLSSPDIYPRFVRLISPDNAHSPVRIQIFKELGWTKIATLCESDELFTLVNSDFLASLYDTNITVLTTLEFRDSASQQLKKLKESDARIIVGGFYEPRARHIFCESLRMKLVYPRVVWILIGWLDPYWWKTSDPEVNCTQEEMAEAVEGSIYTGTLNLDPDDTETISGLRPSEFVQRHRMRNNNNSLTGDGIASQGYDVMWTVALALNATMTKFAESGSGKRLEDFTYKDQAMRDILYKEMLNVTFQGLMGRVSFKPNGDPVGYLKVEQIQEGVRQTICYLHETEVSNLNLSLIRWKNGETPRDGVVTFNLTLTVSPVLHGCMDGLAVLGILLALFFLAFNIVNRDIKFIKLSSPRLNNVILVGCIVGYLTVFIDSRNPRISCQSVHYTFFLGWSLAFGALFSKSWRVHMIFTNPKIHQKLIKDTHLFLMVGVLVVFNLTILLCWSIFDPLTVRLIHNHYEDEDGGETRYNYLSPSCHSEYLYYFQGVLFSAQGILLFLGAFLAWETRKVNVAALNDSRNTAVCIYNSAVLALLYIIVSSTTTLKPNVYFGIKASIMILDATCIQCIIFLPKVRQYRKHRLHPGFSRGLTMGLENKPCPSVISHCPSSSGELIRLRQEVCDQQEEIDKLQKIVRQLTGEKTYVKHVGFGDKMHDEANTSEVKY